MKHGFCHFTYDDGKVFKGFFCQDKIVPNQSMEASTKKIQFAPTSSPKSSTTKFKRNNARTPVNSSINDKRNGSPNKSGNAIESIMNALQKSTILPSTKS